MKRPGPKQYSWYNVLDGCVGPYNNLGSNVFVALWAYTGQLAAFFRSLHGSIQASWQQFSVGSLGPYRTAGCIL
jgi:hypothetical protein